MAPNTTVQDVADAHYILIKSEESGWITTDFKCFSELKQDHELNFDSTSVKKCDVAINDKIQEDSASPTFIDNNTHSAFLQAIGSVASSCHQ